MKKIATELYTVRQFVDLCKGRWPSSEPAVRDIILEASKGNNNFQSAFKRVGRRVLVDHLEFWKCVDKANEKQ